MSGACAAKGFGAIVIGRNEGERLVRCLNSIARLGCPVVYVDSSSTDRSLQTAQRLGATAVTLPTDRPFTAGRARNYGIDLLMKAHANIDYAMFVDGDCEVAAEWPEVAIAHLERHPQAGLVCGRRSERNPQTSIYNAACDIEWDTPVGIAESSGGDFIIRTKVFRQVGGFNLMLIAGEEPEMCYRIRKAGHEIHRIDASMTLHDAAIHRFSQWARRSVRSGYAYAARAWIHRHSGDRYCWRENARIAFWAAAVPAGIALASIIFGPWGLAGLAVYPLKLLRQQRAARRRHRGQAANWYALLVLAGNWTEFVGQCRFAANLLGGRSQRIIEYK